MGRYLENSFFTIARGPSKPVIYPVQSTLEALSIDELRQLIREHEHKYYMSKINLGAPIMFLIN